MTGLKYIYSQQYINNEVALIMNKRKKISRYSLPAIDVVIKLRESRIATCMETHWYPEHIIVTRVLMELNNV